MSDDDLGASSEPGDVETSDGPPAGTGGSVGVSGVLDLLGDERRRRLLDVLVDRPGEAVPVDELVDAVVALETPDPGPGSHRDRVATELHHVHLPKLADFGVLAHDPVAGTVRFEGASIVEDLLAAVDAIEGDGDE